MAKAKQEQYGNSSISMLKGEDRVRKRPAVIFGSDDLEGCKHAVFEILSNAIDEARENGIKVGMIRPITLWPYPKKALLEAADKVKAFICVELNMGQMIEDVELAIRCKKPVYLCSRTGGMIPTTQNVLDKIEEVVKMGGAK